MNCNICLNAYRHSLLYLVLIVSSIHPYVCVMNCMSTVMHEFDFGFVNCNIAVGIGGRLIATLFVQDAARKVGEAIGKLCVEKGISKVAFDRGGFVYHGRIKALADAAREAGLEF